jgi:hypothetical protein
MPITNDRMEMVVMPAGRITYRHPDYPSDSCVYCGEVATSRDHLIPRAFSGESERAIVPVVPACLECNSTLGARYMPDVIERREYLHARYRVKYRKYMRRVMWGPSDMQQFGPQMRTVISKGMAEHERLMRRLSWPSSPTYDADAWSAYWDEELVGAVAS